jgi:predicted RNase H-like HicB family nuclease
VVPHNKALQLTGGEGGSRGGARHSASQALPRSHRVERRPQLNAGVVRTLDAAAGARGVQYVQRPRMKLTVETEREDDGRWIAEVPDLPGVLAYGGTEGEARARAQALALRVVADRLEHGEASPDLLNISFIAA